MTDNVLGFIVLLICFVILAPVIIDFIVAFASFFVIVAAVILGIAAVIGLIRFLGDL